MARDPKHDILFEPIQIGPKTMKNRFYQIPHCNGFGSEKPMSQAYFRAMKAEGGYAAVCTEYCSIHPESDDTHRVSARLWDDDDIKNLALMCDMLHEHGALAAAELWYGGPHAPCMEIALRAARAVADPERLRAPHVPEGDGQGRHPRGAGLLRGGREAGAHGGLRHRLRLRLALLSAAAVPDAVLQQAHGRVRRLVREPGALLARDDRAGARRRSATTARSASACRPTCSWARPARSSSATASRSSSSCDDLVDVWDINVSGISEWGEDATPSRFYSSGRLLPWQKAVKSVSKKPVLGVGRFTNPDLMVEAINDGLARHHRHLPPVDLGPVPAEEDRRGAAGRHPRVHRLQHLHLALGDRRPAAHLHAERDRGRGVPPRLASGGFDAGEERRQRRARRRGRPGRDGVRDDPRQARHAPRAPRRGGGRHGRDRCAGSRSCRASASGPASSTTARSRSTSSRTSSSSRTRRSTRRASRSTAPRSSSSRPARYWATDGLNGCTHDTIPGADASLPWQLTPEQIMGEGKEVAGRARRHLRQRRLLHGRLARREARRGGQEGHADDPPRPHRPVHALHARGAEPAPQAAQARRRDRHVPHADRGSRRARSLAAHVYDEEGHENELAADAVVLVTQRRSNEALYRELKDSVGLDALAAEGVNALYRIGDCEAPRLIADCVFSGHRLAREIDSDDPSMPLPFKRERRVVEREAVPRKASRGAVAGATGVVSEDRRLRQAGRRARRRGRVHRRRAGRRSRLPRLRPQRVGHLRDRGGAAARASARGTARSSSSPSATRTPRTRCAARSRWAPTAASASRPTSSPARDPIAVARALARGRAGGEPGPRLLRRPVVRLRPGGDRRRRSPSCSACRGSAVVTRLELAERARRPSTASSRAASWTWSRWTRPAC